MQKRIGEFLTEKGLLTPQEVNDVLSHSKATGLRFGDAAVDLKLVTAAELAAIFGKNNGTNFFHLHPKLFPKSTRSLFGIETLVAAGALPLGEKQ